MSGSGTSRTTSCSGPPASSTTIGPSTGSTAGLPRHRPVNCGSRFSRNAATPSWPSSLARQRRNASASRRSPSSRERSRVVRASSRSTRDAWGERAAKRARDLRAPHRAAPPAARPLDEAPLVGGARVDRLAADVQEQRAAEPDEPWQPLRPAAARDQPELDLGLAEPRVLGGHADVARARQLEPAAEAPAVDRGDERRVAPRPSARRASGSRARSRLRSAPARAASGTRRCRHLPTNALSPAPRRTIARVPGSRVEPVELASSSSSSPAESALTGGWSIVTTATAPSCSVEMYVHADVS